MGYDTVYTGVIYTSVQEVVRKIKMRKRENMKRVFQDGFGCMSLAQFMPRCVAFSGFTKRP